MGNFKALTIQSGAVKALQSGDVLLTETGGLSSISGNLVLNSASSQISVTSGQNFVALGGTSLLDFSAASGLFKTSTGAVTIGTGALTISASSSTFDNTANFDGDVNLGDATTDTITYTGLIDSNVTFNDTSSRSILMEDQASAGTAASDLTFGGGVGGASVADVAPTAGGQGSDSLFTAGTGAAGTGTDVGGESAGDAAAGGNADFQGAVGGAGSSGTIDNTTGGLGGAARLTGGVGGAGEK